MRRWRDLIIVLDWNILHLIIMLLELFRISSILRVYLELILALIKFKNFKEKNFLKDWLLLIWKIILFVLIVIISPVCSKNLKLWKCLMRKLSHQLINLKYWEFFLRKYQLMQVKWGNFIPKDKLKKDWMRKVNQFCSILKQLTRRKQWGSLEMRLENINI